MREGKYAVVAMRDGPQPSPLLNLTKDDIGLLLELAHVRKIHCIGLSHQNPKDKHYANELTKIKRVYSELKAAFEQKLA